MRKLLSVILVCLSLVMAEEVIFDLVKGDGKTSAQEMIFYSKNQAVAKKVWDLKGNIKNVGQVPNGPIYRLYSDKKVFIEANIKDGKLNGVARVFYPSGKIMSESLYKNDRIEGLAREYYEKGGIKAESFFKKDRINGPRLMYSEDGKLVVNEQYKNGSLEGVSKQFYTNGTVQAEVTFKKGRQEGKFKIYSDKGLLLREGNVGNGKIKEAKDFEYYENGTVKFVDAYKNNVKVSRKSFTPAGKLDFEQKY